MRDEKSELRLTALPPHHRAGSFPGNSRDAQSELSHQLTSSGRRQLPAFRATQKANRHIAPGSAQEDALPGVRRLAPRDAKSELLHRSREAGWVLEWLLRNARSK